MRYHIDKPQKKEYKNTSPHNSGFNNFFWQSHCNAVWAACQV
nr:MAG TPA: hypothetical protein [Caudoviricetes sp.]